MSDCEDSYNAFTKEVNFWKATLGSSPASLRLFELSFFKVFIKFELFLVDSFRSYSLGHKNFKGYIPERKLLFADDKHLDGILRNNRSSFIDYFEKIKNQSEYIFKKDPFQIVFSDASISSKISEMQVIRNMIAHESLEAKSKYQKIILGPHKPYEDPASYLAKNNRKHHKTNYSLKISTMTNAINILLEPTTYF